MKRVSIIIVTYNGLSHLKHCLLSLQKVTYKNRETIVVDNASTDKTIPFLRKHYPEITIVQNTKNSGFAEGNNIGYARAKGDYILFLNNDTEVTPGFLTTMVQAMESDTSVGGVQSKILLMNDKKRLDSVGAFYTYTGFLYHYGYYQEDKPAFDKRMSLYTAKGACMMFRSEVLKKVGLFDPDFFAYFEETDLCHRVWCAGYRILYIPEAVIYHTMGATSNRMDNAFIQYHSYKNRIRSYIKNLDASGLLMMLPVHLFMCECAALGYIVRKKFSLFLAVHRAYLWNVIHIGETLALRETIQKTMRKVHDGDFLPEVTRNPPFGYYYHLMTNTLVDYDFTD